MVSKTNVWGFETPLCHMKVKAKTTMRKRRTTDIFFIKNKEYDLLTEFETKKMFSGICYVINTEIGTIQGFDSTYFTKIE